MRYQGIHDLVTRTAQCRPGEVAIGCADRQVSYGALETHSNRLAQGLVRCGLGKGARIAILADDPAAVIVSLVGVLKAGGVFVPLDPRFPASRLRAMIEQVSPAAFVVDAAGGDRLRMLGAAVPVVRLGRLDADAAPCARPEVAWSGDDPCSIYFTSGSTGRPKAIVGRLSGIDHFARWEAVTIGVTAGTRISQLASPSFDGFLKDAFVPLCAGGVVCAPPSREVVRDAGQLAAWIAAEQIEVLHCVPSVFRALLNQPLTADSLSALRWVVLAGEAVLPADVGRFAAIAGDRIRILNLYGPTETAITKLYYVVQPGDAERASIPIGRPMPGAAALVLNEAGKPQRIGGVGEIYIRTRHCALGYFDDPAQTAAAFVPNPFRDDPADIVYRTGDFGRLLEDGNFEFLGRRDQQIKVRGVRVELPEIENAVRLHPGVLDVAVIDRQDGDGVTSLCAYLVLAAGTTTAALRAHLADQLPEAMVPSAFVALDALPRTLNGKIDRKALPTLGQARATAGATSRPPRTAMEDAIAAIWADVLQLPQVGASESFFELGGHSLLATRIVSRVRDRLGVELPLRALFEAPTVEQLAHHIEHVAPAARQRAARAPRGVVAIRAGRLVHESYEHGDADTLHDLRSVTKSVTSLLLGIALDCGWIHSIDDSLARYLPGFDGAHARIRLRELAEMRSGLAADESDPASPGHEDRLDAAPDWLAFARGIPMLDLPGTQFRYASLNAFLLGAAIESAAGRGLDDIAREHLFAPLGIERFAWRRVPGGHVAGHGNLQLRACDAAAIGQLVLDGGEHQGRRVVSQRWIEDSLTPEVPIPATAYAAAHASAYGYLWYAGHEALAGRRQTVLSASGNGGNKIYIVPDEQLVVAIATGSRDFEHGPAASRDILLGMLPALDASGARVSQP
jgi:amino acid adenylation domain-containing protein